MNHRKLRIAWLMAWGVVAVLLCVLWVRSDVVEWHVTKDQFFQVFSNKVSARISYIDESARGFIGLELLFWAWLLLVAIVAALPLVPPRFSVRTLLIATTLVVITLGLIVWASK